MASVFMHNSGTYRVTSEIALDMHKTLPVGTYVVKVDQQGFFLETVEPFTVPTKLYGDVKQLAERTLNTFTDRPGLMGALLVGEKGSGKTLLAKLISLYGANLGFPTILVNTPFGGDGFNTFLASITQPCIVLFDEFEKVYEDEQQEQLLTLLDGVYGGKKLYVLTANDKYLINSHMTNRPGRLYYFIEFSGVGQEFIREYCADNLKYPEYTNPICVTASFCPSFNFDMLQALVEETNRYKQDPDELVKALNVKPRFEDDRQYEFVITDASGETLHTGFWTGEPANDKISVCMTKDSPVSPRTSTAVADFFSRAPEGLSVNFRWKPAHIIQLDVAKGLYVLRNEKDQTITMTVKQQEESFNLKHLLTL